MVAALTPDELATALPSLLHWTYDEERNALYRKIVLADFSEAIGLMMRIALHAEKSDHHPEWSNAYNRVEIWLTTHDAGDVSERDVALARHINTIVAAMPS